MLEFLSLGPVKERPLSDPGGELSKNGVYYQIKATGNEESCEWGFGKSPTPMLKITAWKTEELLK